MALANLQLGTHAHTAYESSIYSVYIFYRVYMLGVGRGVNSERKSNCKLLLSVEML